MVIGRNTERAIAMIVIGSFVWIIICRFVRGREWRMFLRLVFVSLAYLPRTAWLGHLGKGTQWMDEGRPLLRLEGIWLMFRCRARLEEG